MLIVLSTARLSLYSFFQGVAADSFPKGELTKRFHANSELLAGKD